MRIVGNYTLFFSERDMFSNWYRSTFSAKGLLFNCVEQFMMYCKARLFDDIATADAILLDASHPRDQKALGRAVKGYDDSIWQDWRLSIVAYGCYAKFSHHADLRDALLATGDTILVEASPYDRVWGVGLPADDPCITDPACWRGQNLLGQALMTTRARLRAEIE